MLTGFTRIIVVLHFLRSAMGTQQMPPNQVLIGLALFLTFFIMNPILTEINDNSLIPYTSGLISQEQAIERGYAPLQRFMLDQVETADLELFVILGGYGPDAFETPYDIPARVLVPAFILGELTKGFMIGFILYLPFIVIDMIVASVLMAMGMMMLPPAMISLPFKILLFILGGGWSHVMTYVMLTFRAP
jgi:flagellar biosynthetic protein FliP